MGLSGLDWMGLGSYTRKFFAGRGGTARRVELGWIDELDR